MSLSRHRQDWEDLAQLDPLWAIAADPSRQHGGWSHPDFFENGRRTVDGLMARAAGLRLPQEKRDALDFGCGVGRLTRALAAHFPACTGVDISAEMIAQARRLNAEIPGCRFLLNTSADLAIFPDASFDLVFTTLVLQHLPDRATILGYVAEFVRVLRPGGLLAFQLPHRIRWRYRIQLWRRVYSLLRWLGASPAFLYRRLGIFPMRMNAVPEDAVRRRLAASGARVVAVDGPAGTSGVFENRVYFATK